MMAVVARKMMSMRAMMRRRMTPAKKRGRRSLRRPAMIARK